MRSKTGGKGRTLALDGQANNQTDDDTQKEYNAQSNQQVIPIPLETRYGEGIDHGVGQ